MKFDEVRGFGFIAADDGGEDVFLHASVFAGDPSDLVPGARIEFQIMADERGRKAFAAHLADGAGTVLPGSPPAAPTDGGAAQRATVDDEVCDALSRVEFSHEITELLLVAASDLTGGQIVRVRESMLEFAAKRGWVDA